MADPIKISDIQAVRTGRLELDPRQLRTSAAPTAPAEKSFKDVMAETLGEVQRLQTEADTNIKKLMAGEIKDVTDVMIAVEKADVAFQTMMSVRNKMVQAYEEIMRMQV